MVYEIDPYLRMTAAHGVTGAVSWLKSVLVLQTVLNECIMLNTRFSVTVAGGIESDSRHLQESK